MKPIKILALIVGTITLLPSASFADNVSINTQEANMDSTIIGNGNVVSTETRQSIIQLQKSGRYRTNAGTTSQRINSQTTVVGDGNIDIKRAIQETINEQETK